jgi:hypothetical protein
LDGKVDGSVSDDDVASFAARMRDDGRDGEGALGVEDGWRLLGLKEVAASVSNLEDGDKGNSAYREFRIETWRAVLAESLDYALFDAVVSCVAGKVESLGYCDNGDCVRGSTALWRRPRYQEVLVSIRLPIC